MAASYSNIIWSMSNRPFGGCSSKTLFHPINMNMNMKTDINTLQKVDTEVEHGVGDSQVLLVSTHQ
jgi:hypothetical protein